MLPREEALATEESQTMSRHEEDVSLSPRSEEQASVTATGALKLTAA